MQAAKASAARRSVTFTLCQEGCASRKTNIFAVPLRRLEVARCFLGLADLEKGAFERLGRYEVALWRQVRQTIFTLLNLQMRAPDRRFRRAQDRWQRAVFDAVEDR